MSALADIDATILNVIASGRPWVHARFRRDDGIAGSVMISEREYPAEYWPPAEGDVIRLGSREVSLVARPRGAR